MAVVKVYDQDKTEQGELTLTPEVFEVAVRPEILHLVVRAQLAAKRAGTHSTKTRAMVSGGGVKPWRQKGTGRARQGSTRSPQWTHGGIAFAPKPRTYSYVLNKKVKRLALKSVLSSKAKDGEIVVVDKIAMDEIKTKLQELPDRRQRGRQVRRRDSRGQRHRRQERPQHSGRRHQPCKAHQRL